MQFNTTDSNPEGGIPLSVDFVNPEDYFIFIFQLLLATTTVLVAGPVVFSILRTRTLYIQNRFIFMLNTSICDTLIGFSVYYLGVFDVREGYPSRNSTHNFLPALLGVNMMTFMFAQFDRYFAVCHPFVYTRFLTRTVVICLNVYCWIHVYTQTIILHVLPLSTAVKVYVFSIVSLQVMVVTKVAMTVKLLVVARYQLDRDPPGPERDNKQESLRIIIFAVISFLLLWVPSFINLFLRLIIGRGLTFRNEATNLFANMARFNAVVTSAVYMWGSPALRRALVRTVWGRVCPICKKIR